MGDEVVVKICGLTRMKDVDSALRHGAGAIGLVFTKSPRRITAEQASPLAKLTGDSALRVGLFMNNSAEFVHEIVNSVPLDVLQFHGMEDNRFCASFGLPFLKAVSMLKESEAAQDSALGATAFPDAWGILLDAHEPDGMGGTGTSFDWGQGVNVAKPLWLAGGLSPGNVSRAVEIFQPFAVDVSSGVEVSPGIKDDGLIKSFISNAKNR